MTANDENGVSEARSYGQRASLLSIGVAITGLITYLFFVIASHELSKEEYGQIAVLWSAVFILVSTLQRPVEQLLSRSVSEHIAVGRSYSHPVRVAAAIQLGIAVVFVIIAVALRVPITDGLLGGNEFLFWVGVSAVAAYGASYFARGFLAGSHRLTVYALLIICESISRTAFPLAVALGIASGQDAVALGIVAAPTLSLIVVPFAFLRRGSPPDPPADEDEPEQGELPAEGEFTLAHGGGFAAAVFLIMLSEQTFLNAGPLLVESTAGAAAAGYIFNILMIARAPLQLFQAVSTSLLPHLTRLRAEGADDDFRASVTVTIRAIAAFAASSAVVMAIVGPEIMQIAFGDNFTYERVDLVIVTVGMGLYLSAATLNQAALAQGQVRRAAVCWFSCALVFIAWCLMPAVDDEFLRVEIGYLGGATVLCTLLYLIYRRPHPRAEDTIEPGSAEELEIRLAAGDEVP